VAGINLFIFVTFVVFVAATVAFVAFVFFVVFVTFGVFGVFSNARAGPGVTAGVESALDALAELLESADVVDAELESDPASDASPDPSSDPPSDPGTSDRVEATARSWVALPEVCSDSTTLPPNSPAA
jgi:hypothetical protein